MSNRERAKRLILEILRAAGGGLGKAVLFKAFWLAHLYYVKKAPGYLSDWPVIHMPTGPGIDQGDALLRELAGEGLLQQTHEPNGPYTEMHCRLTDKPLEAGLSEAAVAAVQEAVAFVKQFTAAGLSQWSHDASRSWRETAPGEELDIYADLIPEDEFEEAEKQVEAMSKAYEDIFK
jgi:hypothetical protein